MHARDNDVCINLFRVGKHVRGLPVCQWGLRLVSGGRLRGKNGQTATRATHLKVLHECVQSSNNKSLHNLHTLADVEERGAAGGRGKDLPSLCGARTDRTQMCTAATKQK